MFRKIHIISVVKNSQKPSAKKLFNGKPIPNGQQIYDRIMSKIEPELITANLKTLDAPYKKETKAKRTARYKRYAKAFKEYKKQYKAWVSNLKQAINSYKRAIKKAAERLSKKTEDTALAALEAQMRTA